MSLDLLSVLADREDYERFSRFVNLDSLPKEVGTIVKDIGGYYEDNPSSDCIDWSSFSEWFRVVRHSTWKEDKLETFDRVFSRLESYCPTDLSEKIIEKYVIQDYCQELADIALRGAEGESVDIDKFSDILSNMDKELDRVSKLETFIVSDDLDQLVDDVVKCGYNWRMTFLNKSVGNIRPGKLICFAARPNVGKTTFLASEATYVASQLTGDECIVWFNNEEAGSDVKLRIVQAALGVDMEYITKNPKKALEEYETAINGPASKIKVVDKADINIKDVEEILKSYNVKFIIFDQLWKLHGFEKTSSTDTARLGNIFNWAREIAKSYAPVLTVHQVKTEGEGVEYLTPDLLYLSGTVIQGEVDALIMMGRNHFPGQELNRFISIGKNKGAYGPEVDKFLQEGKHSLMISPLTAEFIEP